MLTFASSQLSWLAALAVIGTHLALGADEFPVVARVLCTVPALIMIVEARGYLRKTSNELPFIVLAMLQFYIAFGFPVLFDFRFFDFKGPVFFTEGTRIEASIAVALGSLGVWGGARAGYLLGPGIARFATKGLPPEVTGRGWDQAFYIYAAATVLMSLLITFSLSVVPVQIQLAVFVIFQLEFLLGIAMVKGPQSLGPRLSWAILAFSALIGMARGQMEPIFRSGMAFVAARWVTLRRIPVLGIALVIVLFTILQPVKHYYRYEVWTREAHTGQSSNVSERVTAWQNAFANASASESQKTGSEASAVERLCELNPMMHAMTMVPRQIPYLYGQSFVEVLYSFIPRLLWPNKPTSVEGISQRYAVIFGLQSERAAQSTAVGMNLLVEGYWNFGWFGVILLCFAEGLVVGASQSALCGGHWALRAIGIAQIATLTVNSTVVLLYSSLFQATVGRLLIVWGLYWMARMLSGRARSGRGAVTRRLARR